MIKKTMANSATGSAGGWLPRWPWCAPGSAARPLPLGSGLQRVVHRGAALPGDAGHVRQVASSGSRRSSAGPARLSTGCACQRRGAQLLPQPGEHPQSPPRASSEGTRSAAPPGRLGAVKSSPTPTQGAPAAGQPRRHADVGNEPRRGGRQQRPRAPAQGPAAPPRARPGEAASTVGSSRPAQRARIAFSPRNRDTGRLRNARSCSGSRTQPRPHAAAPQPVPQPSLQRPGPAPRHRRGRRRPGVVQAGGVRPGERGAEVGWAGSTARTDR